MRPKSFALMALAVLVFILVGHAWSLSSGLFLDDHAHFAHLREGNWSYQSAVDASRLGIVGDVIDLWGRNETGLRFYRPVAFWLMRLEYTLVGWNPTGMHILSLVWHWLCCMLIGLFAWRLIGRTFWAGVAACIAAIHPGHVVTVYWVACQTELMVTIFLLSATLCYARSAGWWNTPNGIAEQHTRHTVHLLASLVLFALAMGCREHAIMWPAVMVVGDFTFRRSWKKQWPAYAGFAAIVVVYFILRHFALHGFPLPGRPYLLRPTDPGFIRHVVEKFVYYTLGLFGFVPILPSGWNEFFATRPFAFYGGFLVTALGILLIARGWPQRRRLLLPLGWMILFFAPLMPIFASCHHLYLPGAGMALIFAIGLAVLAGTGPGPRRVIAGIILALNAVGLSFLAWAFGWTYRCATTVEDVFVREVLEHRCRIKDGDHLFFINFPFYAYYAIPAIEETGGLHNLHGHVLTFSPWLARMSQPGTVQQIDDKTLLVCAPDGDGNEYLSGSGGEMLLKVMGFDRTFATGDVVHGPLFDVHIDDANARGIRKLRFVFREPLNSPNYHFFYGSPVRWAYPILRPADCP